MAGAGGKQGCQSDCSGAGGQAAAVAWCSGSLRRRGNWPKSGRLSCSAAAGGRGRQGYWTSHWNSQIVAEADRGGLDMADGGEHQGLGVVYLDPEGIGGGEKLAKADWVAVDEAGKGGAAPFLRHRQVGALLHVGEA